MADTNPKLCECGCGQPAPIAKRTIPQYGYVKGQPVRFIQRHSFRSLNKTVIRQCSVAGCANQEALVRDMCRMHYTRWWQHGDPLVCKHEMHGLGQGPTWNSWTNMLSRCRNPNNPKYASYGGRGITVCERWLKYPNFVADMGERPKGKTLDRFPDGDGNYEPGNCRWATRREQSNNRYNTRYITHDGETKAIMDWARIHGLTRACIDKRYRKGDRPPHLFRPTAKPHS